MQKWLTSISSGQRSSLHDQSQGLNNFNKKIRDFNQDKGYKYDVPVPSEEKYPYLADRLGHPEILGNPTERLLRLEGEIYHPNWLD